MSWHASGYIHLASRSATFIIHISQAYELGGPERQDSGRCSHNSLDLRLCSGISACNNASLMHDPHKPPKYMSIRFVWLRAVAVDWSGQKLSTVAIKLVFRWSVLHECNAQEIHCEVAKGTLRSRLRSSPSLTMISPLMTLRSTNPIDDAQRIRLPTGSFLPPAKPARQPHAWIKIRGFNERLQLDVLKYFGDRSTTHGILFLDCLWYWTPVIIAFSFQGNKTKCKEHGKGRSFD